MHENRCQLLTPFSQKRKVLTINQTTTNYIKTSLKISKAMTQKVLKEAQEGVHVETLTFDELKAQMNAIRSNT